MISPIAFLAALSCFNALSATDVHYEVSVPRPDTHVLHVEMRIGGCAGGSLDLSMPVWTPGSYLVREYSRHVFYFAAEAGSGEELAWRKIDKNTWRVETRGAEEVTVRYQVYAREPGIRWSSVDADGGHVIGPSLFMGVAGALDRPTSARFELPDGWKLDGGIAPDAHDPCLVRAESYHQLIDTPMLIGKFDSATFEVEGITHLIAFLGPHDADLEKLCADVKKIVEADLALFGSLPYERYAFVVVCLSDGGGIEHRNGTSLGTSGWGFGDEERYRGFLDLVSHEYFHAWNVKSIKPPELVPYNYEEENYFDTLWWYEGVTSYFSPRQLIRAGFGSNKDYVDSFAGTAAHYRQTPGRELQSVAESSFDAWVKAYRSDENTGNVQISYYFKGAILGALLDLEIARRTAGQRGLDDVIRLMWQRVGEQGATFGNADIRAACDEVAGGSFQGFFDKYVYGTDEIPFEEYLGYAGYDLIVDEKKTEDRNKKGYLGARFREADSRATVSSVERGSPAFRGGLSYGDEIIAVDGLRTADKRALDRALEARAPGAVLRLLVARHQLVRELRIMLEEHPVPVYRIEEVEEPSESQLAVRKRWLPAAETTKESDSEEKP